MLPEPPAEVSPLLKPSTIQALGDIIGHKFKWGYYLAQVLVRESVSIVSPSIFNVVTRWANKAMPQYQTTSRSPLGFIGDGILDFRGSPFGQLQTFV